jgi:hypothetical protein
MDPEPLDVARARCRAAVDRLPDALKSLHDNVDFDVRLSARLENLVSEALRRGA